MKVPNDTHGKIINVDCIEGMNGLKAGTVDLAFADPPFNIGYDYDVYHDKKDSDSYLSWTADWIGEVVRLLKPDGTFWLAIGDEYAAEIKVLAQREFGLACRNWVIWYYTFGVHCKKKFTRSHAHLFYFVKDPKNFVFNDGDVRVPSARQLVYADKRANPKGRMPDDTWILRPQDIPDSFSSEEDTWYFPRVCGTFKERAGWHGCQMPEQLLGRIIRSCSNPRDIVLDPFGGSGTTYAVAKKLNRRWLGFELSKEYVERINIRLAGISVGDSLDGSEKPLASAPATPRKKTETREVVHHDVLPRECASPAIQRLNLSLGQVAVANGELATALTEAYLVASDGFAMDRLLADPTLSRSFVEACRELGIPGNPREWFHRLLGLRKAKKLQVLPKRRRTMIRVDDMDKYIFASEIAWRILSERYELSLDEIFCDPGLAGEFDRIAATYAPGWSPFDYRWGAFSLRKRSKKKQTCAKKLVGGTTDTRWKGRALQLDDISRLPEDPGVYNICVANRGHRDKETHLYIGETNQLNDRLDSHLISIARLIPDLNLESISVDDLRVRYLPIDDRSIREGLQSLFLGKWAPRGNAYLEHQAFVA